MTPKHPSSLIAHLSSTRVLLITGLMIWGLTLFLVGAAQAQTATPITELIIVSAPAITPTQSTTPQLITHTIGAGDTLFGIAQRYSIPVDQLMSINRINDQTILQLGQTLIISGVAVSNTNADVITDTMILSAPDLSPVPHIHLVTGGETLTAIAATSGISLEQLLSANQLTLSTTLEIGQPLIIPNQIGSLYAIDYIIQLGDTVEGIAAQFNTKPEFLWAEGPINPHLLIAGETVRIISRTGYDQPLALTGTPHIVQKGETLTTIAKAYNQSPLLIARLNHLPFPTPLFVGQRLRLASDLPYRHLPNGLAQLRVKGSQFVQGESFSLYTEIADHGPISLSVELRYTALYTPSQPFYYQNYSQTVPFLPYQAGQIALIGLDAFVPDGLHTLMIKSADGQTLFEQGITVFGGDYGTQQITVTDLMAPLLDPTVRSTEDADFARYYLHSAPTPSWNITMPLSSPLGTSYLTARYGAARSYNGSNYDIFHSGVDYGAPVDTPVLAPADGTVVFSDVTLLRGNVIIIDHGLGLMTAYFHMNSRISQVGEVVKAGQVIGALGNTGLSTAAHLHWDVRLWNVPVNGLQWLEQTFP